MIAYGTAPTDAATTQCWTWVIHPSEEMFDERQRRLEQYFENCAIFERFIGLFKRESDDTRYVKLHLPAPLRSGRRTRMGRARNAVRQLPMLGAA